MTEVPSTDPLPARRAGLKALILLLLVAGFTAWCVSHSAVLGRLSTSPVYDDCVYFWNGAALLQSFQDKGITGVEQHLATFRLHTPYSVLLAAAAFGVLGSTDTSPYVANALPLLLFLLLLTVSFRHLPFSAWLGAIIIFLTLPFTSMVVAEFRPDPGWAIVTGFGVITLATDPRILRSIGPTALAGLFLGLSLLAKPSTFAMTVILYGLAALFRTGEWLAAGGAAKGGWKKALASIAVAVAVLLVVAGPYYVFFGWNTWSYFWENSFGTNREVWLFHADTLGQFTYYLWGMGGQSNIGYSGIVLLLVYAGGCLSLWRKAPALRARLVAVNALMVVAYLINVSGGMKSVFLGGALYGTWMFSCAFVIDQLFVSSTVAGRRRLIRLVLVVAVLCVFLYRWPRFSDVSVDGIRPKSFRFAELRFEELLERTKDAPPTNILFLQGGPVVMENVGIWTVRHRTGTKVGSGAFLRSVDEFEKLIPDYEWIVLQDPGILGNCEILPSEPHLAEFIAAISADPRFHLLDQFPGIDGKNVYVFAKRKP